MAGMLKDQIPTLVAELEVSRAAAYRKYKGMMAAGIPTLLAGIVLAILITFFHWPASGLLYLVSLLLAVPGAIVLVVAALGKRQYLSEADTLLANTVDKTLFPAAKKDPNRGLILNVLLRPGFFASPDRYYGKNYKTGSYDGISFEQAGYDLQRRERHSDGKGNTYYTYETYAKGTMYRFAYERNFAATVKVLEKSGLLSFGRGGLSPVETEYIAFNKKFQVLTSDETLVFFLLTPQMQEKILSLEGKFKGQFYMAFVGSELYIAIDDNDASIAIPFSHPVTLDNLSPIIECLAIPAVFITLLGLNKAKFENQASVSDQK